MQSVTPPIAHRDLRSPNIYLVTHDDHAPVVAKVADFGLAERVAATVVGQLQTWRWAAPETFDAQCQTYDERADNYSYGIVVWEIASAERRTCF